MRQLIYEVSDGNHESLVAPVFMEDLRDLPMGMKQAVEDFIEAHEGEITTPLVVTVRADADDSTPFFPFIRQLEAASR